MPCRTIDLQTLPATPWKNGGGTTRQLAIHPPEATLDNFAAQGFLVSEGDAVTAKAAFEAGVLTVNDKPMPLPFGAQGK